MARLVERCAARHFDHLGDGAGPCQLPREPVETVRSLPLAPGTKRPQRADLPAIDHSLSQQGRFAPNIHMQHTPLHEMGLVSVHVHPPPPLCPVPLVLAALLLLDALLVPGAPPAPP